MSLQQLTQQALILNLAESYDLEISDTELLAELKKQEAFFDNGVFNKEIYKQVLLRNNLSMKEYETDLKRGLLIQKTIDLLPVKASANESNILNTVMQISDKINYKILSDKDVVIETSDAALKPFWETKSQNFMTEVSYEVDYIKQKKVTQSYDEAEISKHYQENKTHFKDSEGKILSLEDAKDAVVAELNAKATKKIALKTYIAYKKGKLEDSVSIQNATVSIYKNPFNSEALKKISKLSQLSPYTKPILIDTDYYIFKLIKTNPSKAKSYENAKAEVLLLYTKEAKKSKLLELANSSLKSFTGKTTDFITAMNVNDIEGLETEEASDFLQKLFVSKEKRSFIVLNNGKIILYDILEQKLLDNSNSDQSNLVKKLKSAMFSDGLIKNLQNKYKTEIFIQGL